MIRHERFRGGALSLPFHAELFKAPAIFQSGSIRSAQMQLLGKIEGQLLRTLRFDDSFVLLEDAPVLRVELLVGLHVTIVAAGQPIKLSLIHISEPTRLLSISYAV